MAFRVNGNIVISDQTAITTSSISVSSSGWTIAANTTFLFFAYNDQVVALIDTDGNLSVSGDITAFANTGI